MINLQPRISDGQTLIEQVSLEKIKLQYPQPLLVLPVAKVHSYKAEILSPNLIHFPLTH